MAFRTLSTFRIATSVWMIFWCHECEFRVDRLGAGLGFLASGFARYLAVKYRVGEVHLRYLHSIQ